MSETRTGEDRKQATPPEETGGRPPESGFAQSKAHALMIRMFDLRRGGFLGYGALYALCRIVRAIFHTG
jgi:hypothetical protein